MMFKKKLSFIHSDKSMTIIRSDADLRNRYNDISKRCHTYDEPVYILQRTKKVILRSRALTLMKECREDRIFTAVLQMVLMILRQETHALLIKRWQIFGRDEKDELRSSGYTSSGKRYSGCG